MEERVGMPVKESLEEIEQVNEPEEVIKPSSEQEQSTEAPEEVATEVPEKGKKKRKKRVKKQKEEESCDSCPDYEYKVKGCLKELTATSRASVKITANAGKDNIYTFEATATLYIPEGTNSKSVNMDEEFKALFKKLNNCVDDQIQDAEGI